MRRRRGPGLLVTAAVVGTAAHIGASSANKSAAAPAAPAASAVDPTVAELQNLANLHNQGILSDEEFAAAKAKALGI